MPAVIPRHPLAFKITDLLDVRFIAHNEPGGKRKHTAGNDAHRGIRFFIVAGPGRGHVRIENINDAHLQLAVLQQRHPGIGTIIGLHFVPIPE